MTDPDSSQTPPPAPTPAWERDMINRLAFAALTEQRRARRWSVFFKTLLFVYLFALLFVALPDRMGEGALPVGRHTALVDLEGIIAPESDANADLIVEGLRKAFEDKRTAGVILRINSPGGSPVQAGAINDAIRRLRKEHPKTPLYAVITDLCASGGYYVAVAADRIYADKASIVGSIGVLMNGFGFVDAMQKLGIERRLYTAGEHKAFLDPFSPSKDSDVKHAQALLGEIHRQFIAVVKQGRGARLKNDPDLFSGLVWTGEQGVALGLVDGLGDSDYVAREVIGEEDIVNYTPRPDFFQRFAERVGTTMGNVLARTVGVEPVLR